MRVLLDECLPGRKLAAALPKHDVRTVAEMGWRGRRNGALLALAAPTFDASLTVDRSLCYQQRTAGVGMLIVVLRAKSNRIQDLRPLLPAARDALRQGRPGEVVEIRA